MTTGTILYCFILVVVVLFIQWMIIGYCINNLHKRIDEEKKVQEARNWYHNSRFDSIDYALDNIDNKMDDVLDFIESYEHKTFEGD